MKALFIGGTGVISTECVRLALEQGWDVTLLNRGTRQLFTGARWLQADIHDTAKVEEVLGEETFDVVAQFIGFRPADIERDIALFAKRTRQYLYVSSASVYQKPVADYPITESTPLINPYWAYSREKIACEDCLMQACRTIGFPVTIVRPSHTYNGMKVPVAFHGHRGNWQTIARILEGKPVIVPGDGTALWTLTHASDFAKGFVGLMGNPRAIGQAVHITSDESLSWNQIYSLIGEALQKPVNILHVATDFLAAHSGPYDFRGELLGDKAANVFFDNHKIKHLVPGFTCTVPMATGIRQSVQYMLGHPEEQNPDYDFDVWCDRIVACMEAAHHAYGTR